MKQTVLPEMIEDTGFPNTLVFSKDGRAFLSERVTGRIWQLGQDENFMIRSFPIVPLIGHHETGLLGIALDPEFETNNFIYCYYTYGSNEKDMRNKVVRIKIDEPIEDILIDYIPAGMIHNGGIIAFGPDGKLYIGVGVNNTVKEKSQDINYLGGKVLRINKDGSIPEDNPFPDSVVYSYGHRNIFGMAFHPVTGKLYISDVGPKTDDEINIIEKGGNYGWPEVMGFSRNEKFVNPIISYTPVITPTQLVFVDQYLYFGGYNDGRVHRLTLGGRNFDKVLKDEIVYQGKPFGIIGVFYGPDEKLYLAFSDMITRINLK